MSRRGQQISALTLALAAGLVVLACAGILGSGAIADRRQAPADKSRLAALRESAKTDAAQSTALATEYKRQTDATLARQRQTGRLAIGLIAAAAAFLAGVRWVLGLRAERLIPLEALREYVVAGGRRSPDVGPRFLSELAPPPPATDAAFVNALVAETGRSPDYAIPLLQAIQQQYRYLPPEALRRICELTEVTPAQVAGLVTFYAQFRHAPVGRYLIRICHGTACHVAGARQISEELRRRLAIPAGGDTDAQRRFTLEEVACLGCCSLAPVLMADGQTAGRLTPATAAATLGLTSPEPPA